MRLNRLGKRCCLIQGEKFIVVIIFVHLGIGPSRFGNRLRNERRHRARVEFHVRQQFSKLFVLLCRNKMVDALRFLIDNANRSRPPP